MNLRHSTALTITLALHVAIGYALLSSISLKTADVASQPVWATGVEGKVLDTPSTRSTPDVSERHPDAPSTVSPALQELPVEPASTTFKPPAEPAAVGVEAPRAAEAATPAVLPGVLPAAYMPPPETPPIAFMPPPVQLPRVDMALASPPNCLDPKNAMPSPRVDRSAGDCPKTAVSDGDNKAR